MSVFVGTAGWSIPVTSKDRFPSAGTQLERYAQRLTAVEINTSFYRPHRRATYEKWAAAVPSGFRFSVKLPKTITHECRLENCSALIERFADECQGLGEKLAIVLVQLPPSFAYPGNAAERFFEALQAAIRVGIVLEPRHASWFSPEVDAMLARRQVARVAADPTSHAAAGDPASWPALAYFRLHGTPKIYDSPYDEPSVAKHAAAVTKLAEGGADIWTIYDNTMHGAATQNAMQLQNMTA